MGLEVRVTGAAQLHRLADQIRREGRKDLSRQLSRGLSRAAEPVKQAIKVSAEQTMPRAGGYSATFEKSIRYRVANRSSGNSARVSLTTYADGKGERRDIVALEGGRLRHPVFGRRKSPWTITRIRPGFHKRGTDGALDEAARQMVEVVNDLAKRLID